MNIPAPVRRAILLAGLVMILVTISSQTLAEEAVDSGALNVPAEFSWKQVGSEFGLSYRGDKICEFELLVGDGDG